MTSDTHLLLGIDIGTGSCKAVLFTAQGHPMAVARSEYLLYRSSNGVVEQAPQDYLDATVACIRSLCRQIPELPEQLLGIGLTGQVPTDIFLDADGKPLMHGISWQDSRAEAEASIIAEHYTAEEMEQAVGSNVPISSAWSASRLLWVKRNRPDIAEKCKMILMPKDYVGFFLTGRYHSDGWSCKSTVHLQSGRPCRELLEFLGFSEAHMPSIRPWGSLRGGLTAEAAATTGLKAGTPVAVGCSDGPAAMLGCGILSSPYIAFDSCGTSEIVGFSTELDLSCRGLMTIPSCVTGSHAITYAPTQSGSSSILWLAEKLLAGQMTPEELFARAASAPSGSNGLLFLPYLAGERGPIWESRVRGSFTQIDSRHGCAEFARAVMEGVALSVRHCLAAGESARNGRPLTALRLTGGGSRNPLWRQIKADVCCTPVELLECDEACALGAAITAAVAVGLYPDCAVASERMVRVKERIMPSDDAKQYDAVFERYLREAEYSLCRMTAE